MKRNRPPLLLGLDIGGTKSAAIVGTRDGQVLARAAGPTPHNWRDALPAFVESLHYACAEYGCEFTDASALGISCGGPLDSRTGIVYSPPNLPGWDDVPLKHYFEAATGLPVAVENDADATALAEHRWGAGRGCTDMAFLTMGTGIGGGLILDGSLYRGRRNLAGEIGHAVVCPHGPVCLCGKQGCLEAMASGTAIGRMGRERLGNNIHTSEIVCALARSGDKAALELLHEAAGWMALGLSNLLHTLNLERIILGTLAVHAHDLLMEPIRQQTERLCWPRTWEGVQILPAALGDAAQDMAALAAALSHQ